MYRKREFVDMWAVDTTCGGERVVFVVVIATTAAEKILYRCYLIRRRCCQWWPSQYQRHDMSSGLVYLVAHITRRNNVGMTRLNINTYTGRSSGASTAFPGFAVDL